MGNMVIAKWHTGVVLAFTFFGCGGKAATPDANTPAVATADTATTDEDLPLSLVTTTLLANDTNPSGAALRIVSAQAATHGKVALSGNQITFTPDLNFSGDATFEYTLTDGNTQSSTTVTVQVTPFADAPILNVTDVTGVARTPIPLGLNASLFDTDGSEQLAVTIAGMPGGSVLSLATAPLVGDGAFGKATRFQASRAAHAVAVGDLNADNQPDLVVAGSNTLSIFLGDSHGALGVKTDVAIPGQAIGVAISDLNGDGKLDLAAATAGAKLTVLLGNGTGTFAAHTEFAIGNNALAFVLGDFNGDTKIDAVTANNSLSVLLGNGDGTFQPQRSVAAAGLPDAIAIGDVNGDTKLDLVTGNQLTATVGVRLGDGSGAFGAQTNFPSGTIPFGIALGDVNADGALDIITANNGANTVSVLLGNGAGTFGAKTDFAAGDGPTNVALHDFDGDGKLDLAVSNYRSSNVSVMRGDGAGHFAMRTNYRVDTDPIAMIAADVDGDGASDLVTANETGNSASVLLGGARSLGTVTTKGTAVFGGRVDFAVAAGPKAVAPVDLDGDGVLDLAVAGDDSHQVSILLGNGRGDFTLKSTLTTSLGAFQIAPGDFNGDGKKDLAVAAAGATNAVSKISIFLGNGDGTFSGREIDAGNSTQAIVTGDLNGDNKLDLITANHSSTTVSVFLGDGQGGFGASTDFPGGNQPKSLLLRDLNGDGKLDIAAADQGGTMEAILFGDGAGGFAAPVFVGAGRGGFSVTSADFNHDGFADLAFANIDDANVSVLLATGPGTWGTSVQYTVGTTALATPFTLRSADFNGDGNIDLATSNVEFSLPTGNISILLGNPNGTFAPATNFAAGAKPQGLAVGDFDGDGIADLICGNNAGASISLLTQRTLSSVSIAGAFAMSELRLTPPASASGVFALKAIATATETANANAASTSKDFTVTVAP